MNLVRGYENIPGPSVKYVMDYLKSKKAWLDGVVISGGEPTIHPFSLLAMLDSIKAIGLPVCLHTNGLSEGLIERLLDEDLVRLVAMDIKGPWGKYPQLTGVSDFNTDPEVVEAQFAKNFSLAMAYPDRFYFRTTLVPSLTEEDLVMVRGYLPEGFTLVEQPFRLPVRREAA